MNKHVSLTSVQLDPETAALLEEEARRRGCARDALAAYAIRCHLEYGAAAIAEMESDPGFDAFVQVGIDAADRGDVIPHEEVMAKLERMRAKYEARCRE